MAIIVQGEVGPQASNAGDSTPLSFYLGRQGQVMAQDYLPRYVEAGYRGQAFTASAQGGIAVTNLNSTCTGFYLVNPLGSGKILWLVEILFFQTSTAAAAANAGVQLAANTNPLALGSYTLTTPLTVQPTQLGSQALSVARAGTSITLPATPVAVRNIWQPSVSATATTSIPPFIKDEVAGAVGIAPGCAVSMSALTALSGATTMTWIETPQ